MEREPVPSREVVALVRVGRNAGTTSTAEEGHASTTTTEEARGAEEAVEAHEAPSLTGPAEGVAVAEPDVTPMEP